MKPASVFLDLVPSADRSPIPTLPDDLPMLTPETIRLHLESRCDDLEAERFEQAQKVKSHVRASLNSLINKENVKFHSYERDQDRNRCMQRVAGYEQRLDNREKRLDRQGRIIIAQNIPIALAYVEPATPWLSRKCP